MLNIERYKEELKKCKRIYLDCEIYRIREKCKEENDSCGSKRCFECRKDNIEWLLEEYKEPILNDVEKEYLSAVIKPFRDKVDSIRKIAESEKIESILIYVNSFNDSKDVIYLPRFEKGKMYQNMKDGKYYTLEELGL